ncbi:2-isopropylmalate synthase [Paramyrothecium foliicola]|nr:2-isopropylmalate synthase [Paramyrothecium foliicola]
MDVDAKFRYFQTLVKLGYKEIEISYPSASQTEYDFTRRVITTPGVVPDDVWIQVMAPCRQDLIRETIEAARGAKKVILHIHMSTSGCFRDVVFNMTETEQIELAERCTHTIRKLTKDSQDPEMAQTEWTLELTAENFQDTSPDYALKICEAVMKIWQPTEENKIIFNLPATVEMAMPNIFADQIEYFCDRIPEREKVCVSLHCHNDRGCAVAATEMAQLAGGDRVEGCLFGNGERTGNVDLVTLALNLHTQGISPGIDFSSISDVVDMVEELTKIQVHDRAPYAGKLVFCTYTGTHQDAIRKGYKRRAAQEKKLGRPPIWQMPFLPMDPRDLGKEHEAVIRINSQSGKGGVAWYVAEIFNIDLPRDLEVAFTKVVKSFADDRGIVVSHGLVEKLFRERYMLEEKEFRDLISSRAHFNSALPSQNTANKEESHKVTYAQSNGMLENTGVGKDCSEAIKLANVIKLVKDLGFYFESVIDHKTQSVELSENLAGRRMFASSVRVNSKSASSSWGVSIHKDSTLSLLQAVSIASPVA